MQFNIKSGTRNIRVDKNVDQEKMLSAVVQHFLKIANLFHFKELFIKQFMKIWQENTILIKDRRRKFIIDK